MVAPALLLLLLLQEASAQPVNAPAAADARRPWVEVVSWTPRAFYFHNFLTPKECDHIQQLATPKLRRSAVLHANGTLGDDPIRTSWSTHIRRAKDETIRAIDLRVARWTHLPPEFAEDMQVLRYQPGQKYGAHWDEIDPATGQAFVGGGRTYRVATCLMYLADVEEGGETSFPRGKWIDEAVQTAGKTYSDCGAKGIAVHPKKGDAIFFHDMLPRGDKMDLHSLHTACPVIKGEKWSATKWIHWEQVGWSPYHRTKSAEELEKEERAHVASQERWRLQREADAADPCHDSDPSCEGWAWEGECERNAGFMDDSCPRSCDLCCAEGDAACELRRAERRQARAQVAAAPAAGEQAKEAAAALLTDEGEDRAEEAAGAACVADAGGQCSAHDEL